jgi:hypothetical protein
LSLCDSLQEAMQDTSAFNELQDIQAGSGLSGGGSKRVVALSVDTEVVQARIVGKLLCFSAY